MQKALSRTLLSPPPLPCLFFPEPITDLKIVRSRPLAISTYTWSSLYYTDEEMETGEGKQSVQGQNWILGMPSQHQCAIYSSGWPELHLSIPQGPAAPTLQHFG